MNVQIINKSSNVLPHYATEGSAGMDLRADLKEEMLLQPNEIKLVPTGLYMQLPVGFEAQIRPRSGMGYKGITIPNAPGTIDADYRGEIKVILMNLTQEAFRIENGDRIAQMVIARCTQVAWEEVEVLEQTERGVGGFGHTGKQ